MAVALKGPALAAALGLGAAGRQYFDIDILVRRSDAALAWDVLSGAGYQTATAWSEKQRRQHLTRGKGVVFLSPRGIQVELHWALTGRTFGVCRDPAPFMQRSAPMPVAGHLVPCLDPADLFIVLSVHGYKHCWSELKWLCDLALLTQTNPRAKWPAVLARARALGCERILLSSMALAGRLTGVSLPPEVIEGLDRCPGLQARVEKMFDLLACGREWTPAEKYTAYIHLSDSLTARIRLAAGFCAGRMRPGAAERNLVTLPAALAFLYFAIRPLCVLVALARRSPRPRMGGRLRTVRLQ
jgi:hypothetical protein